MASVQIIKSRGICLKEVAKIILTFPDRATSLSPVLTLRLLDDIKTFLKARNEFPLIRLSSPPDARVCFAGDTHGDIITSHFIGNNIVIQSQLATKKPTIMVFLGDYIDRAPDGMRYGNLKNILYLLCLKYYFSDNIFLLRGNHEAYDLTPFSPYDFLLELRNLYGDYGDRIHNAFLEIFSYFPLFLLTENGIFASHGAFPKGISNLSTIRRSDTKAILNTIWGDPVASNTYRGDMSEEANFTNQELNHFLDSVGAKAMIRGHDYNTQGKIIYDIHNKA